MPNDRAIAYFTMEIAIEQGMLTYSGGLPFLAKIIRLLLEIICAILPPDRKIGFEKGDG